MGPWVSTWFVGIGVVGSWVSAWLCRGCAVVRGYQCGSICLISIKFCCGLIFDLVRLFCFCCCGWWLQVENWKRKVVGNWIFFFPVAVICGCGWWGDGRGGCCFVGFCGGYLLIF